MLYTHGLRETIKYSLSYVGPESPPPPDEKYFGQAASKASAAHNATHRIDDPVQCESSLVLDAQNDLQPIRQAHERVHELSHTPVSDEQMWLLTIIILICSYDTSFIPAPYELPVLGILSCVLFVALVIRCGGALFVKRRINKMIRTLCANRRTIHPGQHTIPVHINPPWIYQNTNRNCDYGLAIFDPANHTLIIEGLHYRYVIHQHDITQLKYLKGLLPARDVYLNITIHNTPFELILTRHTKIKDTFSLVLPWLTPRLVKLAKATLGEGQGRGAEAQY